MAAPVAVAAVKVIGPENLGKVFLYLVAFLAAALLVLLAAPIGLVVIASTSASAAAPVTGASPVVVGDWGAPMASYDLRRGFGYNPVAGCSFCSTNHHGQDMGNGCGSAIYSAGPGTVTLAGPYTGTGYGNAVIVDHGGGITTVYAHMPAGGPTVVVGQVVKAGDLIGAEGSSGASTGCHLHFEVRQSGEAIDPVPFLLQRGITL